MYCYKSHRNIYFTISASTKKKFPSEVKKNEIKQNKKMYRLTDILMSKTIQFSLLEFLIFHNLKSGDKVVRFISSFNTLWHVLLGVIAAVGEIKIFTRWSYVEVIDQIQISFSSWIQLIFHILIYRRHERARSFSLYDNLICFLFYLRWLLFVYSPEFVYGTKKVVIEIFVWFWFITSRSLSKKNKDSWKAVRCFMDDSIKQYFERMNLFLTQLGNEFMEFLSCSENKDGFVS